MSTETIVVYGSTLEEAQANFDAALLARAADPSLATQLGSFAAAMVRFAAAGFPTLDDGQVEARLTICHGCEHFSAPNRCEVCTCQLSVKARMATEDCPLGKWPGARAVEAIVPLYGVDRLD